MKKLFVLFALAALAIALPAVADTITLTGVSGNSQGGVYTAPYYLDINGTSYNAMCVDYSHHSTVGESWDGSVTNLASADLSDTRLGASAYATYRAEAWLYSQFLSGAGSSGDINYAAWALTDANAQASAGWTAGAQHWFDLATTTDLSAFDSAAVHFNIITPRDLTGVGPQEFLVQTTDTPEPASLILLGSGMLGLAGFARKKLH